MLVLVRNSHPFLHRRSGISVNAGLCPKSVIVSISSLDFFKQFKKMFHVSPVIQITVDH